MKQIIIAVSLLVVGILILVLSNNSFLLTLSSIFFIGAAGFLILGITNLMFQQRHGDMDAGTHKNQRRK